MLVCVGDVCVGDVCVGDVCVGDVCVGDVCLTSSVEMCVVSSEYRRLSTDIQFVNVDSFILLCVFSPVFYKCFILVTKRC